MKALCSFETSQTSVLTVQLHILQDFHLLIIYRLKIPLVLVKALMTTMEFAKSEFLTLMLVKTSFFCEVKLCRLAPVYISAWHHIPKGRNFHLAWLSLLLMERFLKILCFNSAKPTKQFTNQRGWRDISNPSVEPANSRGWQHCWLWAVLEWYVCQGTILCRSVFILAVPLDALGCKFT